MSRMSELQYPDAPGFKATGTSEAAAIAVAPVARTLRDLVKRTIATSPGLTADEIASRLQKSPLSIRPRVSELRRLGEIRQADSRGTNASGMTASRWEVAPPLAGEGDADA